MARVFKATYSKLQTVKDADGQTVYELNGKGKPMPKRVPVLDKQGKPVLAESQKWYVEYRDADGIIRRVPGHKDKRATEQLAAKLERDAERKASGLVNRYEEQLRRPLSEHLAEWHSGMLARAVTQAHADRQKQLAEAVLNGCGFRFYRDVQADAVQQYLADAIIGKGDRRARVRPTRRTVEGRQ